MFSVLQKLFDSNEKEIKKLQSVVSEINSFEKKVQKLKDSDFPKKTAELREKIKKGTPLVEILPEAFALVKEASFRAIGKKHYDVQLMAAVALAAGKISEQKTGEGKTLSAIPALYLHSLTGKAVHLVTVNDYLARRDAGWMGPVFHLLGVGVSSIIHDASYVYDPNFKDEKATDYRLTHLRPISRKEAYEKDIVYGINSEFGFDYLRDNMASSLHDMSQRGYYFAIVDEVDSVLIDEARTPHIISAPDEVPTQKYYEYAKLVEKLVPEIDYKIDEKLRNAHLTDHGLGKIEKLFGIANIYENDFDTVYHLEAALKARTLFHKEKEYIVKDNQVILVDEFTGRLMEGRRLSEGLHQAIEAKENVPIQRESKTLATVSLQNYFRKYEVLSGMTGTAATESEEFHKIYKLDVIVVPTHKATIRKDLSDSIYKTARAKLSAVIQEIEDVHKTGQPILVGTTSIDKNEIISEALKRRKIPHEVLNAKNHVREAEIIANAGKLGAVTVATNMAGRGVDIVLGGDTPKFEDGREKTGTREWKEWEKNHNAVIAAGGLYVIGTERHESRRIDNQLRGRSGRQGDPGTSRFFVSLDDEIMRLFGGDKIAGLMTRFNMPEDVPLEHPLVSRAIEQAQIKVEGFNFDNRKHVVEYDDVLNKQREIIYERRKNILEAAANTKDSDIEFKEQLLENVDAATRALVMEETAKGYSEEKSPNERIIDAFSTILPFDENSQKHLVKQLESLPSDEQKQEFLFGIAKEVYEKREEQLGSATMRNLECFVLRSCIDKLWVDHLDAIENLRGGIGLRGYAQKDPLVEYKNEAFQFFEKLIASIDDEAVHMIYRVQVVQNPQMPHVHAHENIPAGEVSSGNKQQVASSKNADSKKLGRNDPCWCGSGKKYKKCHYPN